MKHSAGDGSLAATAPGRRRISPPTAAPRITARPKPAPRIRSRRLFTGVSFAPTAPGGAGKFRSGAWRWRRRFATLNPNFSNSFSAGPEAPKWSRPMAAPPSPIQRSQPRVTPASMETRAFTAERQHRLPGSRRAGPGRSPSWAWTPPAWGCLRLPGRCGRPGPGAPRCRCPMRISSRRGRWLPPGRRRPGRRPGSWPDRGWGASAG